jgi:SAM-dependent methyltransferase
MAVDPAEYRQESRRRWGRSAAGWQRRSDLLREATMPVSAWMVEAIDPQPGHTILELAAGPGDTGFLAAELIEPGGTLICSDFAPEMLTAAQARAADLGVTNVRFKQIDAESIDQPAASLDGLLCRWGYMLMADPEAALRETRRVLRPGARVALAAWTSAEENRWSSDVAGELVRRGLMPPPQPGTPGQFAWGAEGEIAERLEAAGFTEYEVDAVEFAMRFPHFDGWWEFTLDMARGVADAVEGLDEDAHEDLRAALRERFAEFVGRDGEVAIPARTWVAVAAA